MSENGHIFRQIRKGSQSEKLVEQLTERPRVANARSIATVAAMAESGMGMRLTCLACGGDELVRPAAMVARFGAATALADIVARCGECGATALQRIPEAMPGPPVLQNPSE